MADCPRCGDYLADPRVCRACGWKTRTRSERKSDEPLEHVPCAYFGCGESARCKVQMPTGWASLCLKHYELYYARVGDAAMTANGLDKLPEETRDEWRKRVFAHWKELAAKAPMNQRLREAA